MGDDHTRRVKLGHGLVWLMAAASGLTAANLYYNQPLLGDIGRELGATRAAGWAGCPR